MHRFVAARLLAYSCRCLSRSTTDDENRLRNVEGKALEKQVLRFPPPQLIGRSGVRLDVATGHALLKYITVGCPKAMERKEEIVMRIIETYKDMPLRLAMLTEGSNLTQHPLLVHHSFEEPFEIEEWLRALRMDGKEGRQLGRSLDALLRYRQADEMVKADMILREPGLLAQLLHTDFDDEDFARYTNLPTPKLELDLSGSIRCTGEECIVIAPIEVKRSLNTQVYQKAAMQLDKNTTALAKALKATGLAKQVDRRGVLVFQHPLNGPPVSQLQEEFARKMPTSVNLPPLELVQYKEPLRVRFLLAADAELFLQELRKSRRS